ncbi:MAG: hypothetical protein B6D68_03650 [spirochete symbiont of Stewartia floridana]|nr:MAG: hypothetical protein B6D68_03650 [spirochete symbiont of Stewartia floridana]
MVNSLRPASLDDALSFRSETQALPFAGGTDLMVRRRGYSGTGPQFGEPILFLDAVEALKGMVIEEGELRIGASVTLSELLNFSPLPKLLRHAVEGIAAPGLRNRATLAGNIANASPAADSLPPLYVHGAVLVLASVQGERFVPVEKFLTGPGATLLAGNEIIREIRIPLLARDALIYYRKVGTRRANALSKLSAAGYAHGLHGQPAEFRFALGAVAPTVIRLSDAETLAAQDAKEEQILEAAGKVIRPIDDQRSTAAYRKQASLNILREFLRQTRAAVK